MTGTKDPKKLKKKSVTPEGTELGAIGVLGPHSTTAPHQHTHDCL